MQSFFNNQLSRSQQVARFGQPQPVPHPQAVPQPQAQVPQGEQRVAVGGAALGYGPPGTRGPWGSGAYNLQNSSPNAMGNLSTPNFIAPMGDASMFTNPLQVIRQAVVPICCISQAEPGGLEKCVQCFPDHGRIYPSAAKGGNGFGEICIRRITAGGADNNRVGNTMIDAGIYGSDGILIPVDLGCVQREQPISICFKAFSTLSELPFLILCFFGTRDQAWNSCEPGLPLALAASGFGNYLYPQAA